MSHFVIFGDLVLFLLYVTFLPFLKKEASYYIPSLGVLFLFCFVFLCATCHCSVTALRVYQSFYSPLLFLFYLFGISKLSSCLNQDFLS